MAERFVAVKFFLIWVLLVHKPQYTFVSLAFSAVFVKAHGIPGCKLQTHSDLLPLYLLHET